MKRPIVVREGWAFIAFFGALTTLAAIAYWPTAFVPGLLTLLCVWFFRDPERPIPSGDRSVVAPADGKIMFVREVDEPLFVGGRALQVSIFLSIFDVHINRVPVSGKVTFKQYLPGKFLAAWDVTVGEVNERSYIGIDTGRWRVLVSQVAGLVARRIITWSAPGDSVLRGDRLGLIRFGSCTQLWLPLGSEVTVKPGDRVIGGETLVGRLPQ